MYCSTNALLATRGDSTYESNYDDLLIDSGAQVCVCQKDYSPEIRLLTDGGMVPEIRNVTGQLMRVYGIKFIDYQVSANHWVLVKYYVCDVEQPILSACGLTRNDYTIVMGPLPQLWKSERLICPLVHWRGLHFLRSRNRRNPPDQTELFNRVLVAAMSGNQDHWKM